MTVAEIIQEIPKLKPEEREEIQACLDEYAPECDDECEEGLSPEEHAIVMERLEDWKKHPEKSIPFEESMARVFARLKL